MMAVTLPERPADSLGAKAAINTDQDVERAMRELFYLEAAEAAIDAEVERRCKEIRDEAAEAKQLQVGSRSCTFAGRRLVLQAAIQSYVFDNEGTFFPKGKRTRKLDSGEVSLRSVPDSVGYEEDVDLKAWRDHVEQITLKDGKPETGIVSRLQRTLNRERIKLPSGKKLALADVAKVAITPDLQLANSQRKAKKLTGEGLAHLKLHVVTKPDKFCAKPEKFTPQTDAVPMASAGSSPGGAGPGAGP